MVRTPVEAGHFHGASGLGTLEIFEPTAPLAEGHAVDFIVRTLRVRAEPGSVSIAVTGPLTNLAVMALVMDPGIAARIGTIARIMGGARSEGGNITASAEYNIHADPHAAQVVFSSGCAITVLGLDATHQVRSTAARVARIRALGSTVASAVADLLQFSNHLEPNRERGDGAPLHDPCPIAWMLQPELFASRPCRLQVETCSPLSLGHTAVEFRASDGVPMTTQWVTQADAAGVFDLLHARLASLAAAPHHGRRFGYLDIVASAERLPTPGETITGARLARHPGGEGANQALAARRRADVHLLARIGRDAAADEALSLLRASGVHLEGCGVDDAAATGVALIAVAASGENQIVIAPGANAGFRAEALQLPAHDAGAICQLEIPLETVSRAAALATGFFCINLAPAMAVPQSLLDLADLVVVNDTEAAFYGESLHGLVAVTHGARGATLLRHGRAIARATPPAVNAVDTTGSGDAFVAALTLAMIEGQAPQRALQFACAAGAAAATRAGAQPSLPSRDEVETLLNREPQ